MMQFTQQRWCNLADSFNIDTHYQYAEYSKLKNAYSEEHRAYHDRQHISECLEKLDWARSAGYDENLPQIETALWYHDAVYNPRSRNNERESAKLCMRFLLQAQVGNTQREVILNMIMATEHTGIPKSESERLVLDIDLAILGASEERFAEYEAQIRREYQWVPWFLYKKKRRDILQSFLQRPRIFSTKLFYDAYEERARSNILASIHAG